MSDLAERIREHHHEYKLAGMRLDRNGIAAAKEKAGAIVFANAPTILAGLAAIEERDKLRDVLVAVEGRLLQAAATSIGRRALDHADAALSLVQAALQPTPETTKEK